MHSQGLSAADKPRYIDFKGTCNFRDLGGYLTQSGKRVNWCTVYRSDHLAGLTRSDLKRFEQLNIQLIIDTRTPSERTSRPNRLPKNNPPRTINFPIEVGNRSIEELKRKVFFGQTDGLDLHSELIQNYKLGVTTHGKEVMALIELLCDPDNLPALIHCNSGKDRTGIACALLLEVLGVDRETIFQDYLLSATFMEKMVNRLAVKVKLISLFRADTAQLRHMLSTRRVFLQAAFDEMERLYGSSKAYLRAIGFTESISKKLVNNLCT